MTSKPTPQDNATGNALAMAVLNSVQNPVILVDEEGKVAFANWEAESFFGSSAAYLEEQDFHLHSFR